MKKKLLALGFVLAMVVLFTGCSSFSGVVPVVTIDGVELTIGESSIGTLIAADSAYRAGSGGKELSPGAKLDGNSWLSGSLYLSKNDQRYASVCIYNPGKESKNALNCPISELTFEFEDTAALVNGIDFSNMDSAGVKQTMKDYKLAHETDTGTLRYEDGDYQYFFTFQKESGLVEEIRVRIVFPKSYQEKPW